MGRLVSRLGATRQLVLVGLVATLMLAAPGALVLQSDLQAIDHAQQQAAALEPAGRVLEWVRATQRFRGLATAVQAGNAALVPRQQAAADDVARAYADTQAALAGLDRGAGALRTRVERLDQRLATLRATLDQPPRQAAQTFEAFSSLIEDQLQVVETLRRDSGLMFQAEATQHHLELAVLHHLPALGETLARLRGDGTRLLTLGQAGLDDRTRLAALQAQARDRMRSADEALGLAMAEPGPPGLDLAAAAAAAEAATARALDLADHAIVRAPRLTHEAADFFSALSVAVDAQYGLIQRSFDLLRLRLDDVASSARRRLALEAAGGAALALFCGWALRLVTRAQRLRSESDARTRAIFDAAPDALLLADAAGVVLLANPAAERQFGRRPGALAGQPLGGLLAAPSHDSLGALLAAAPSQAEAAAPPRREVQALRPDGSPFPAEIACTAVGDGEARRLIIVLRDLTERQRLERQLSQSQKMEAIGQLTGGIAHDFNNLLGVIVGNLDLLERAVGSDSAAMRRVATAQKAAQRGADLTRRLLTFSRRQHLEPAPLSLADALAGVVEMAVRTLGPEIRIDTALHPDTPTVLVDASALENAVLNLAVNARDAMPQGGRITIEAGPAELDANHPAVRAGDLQPGRYATLRVSDTGQGIPRDQLGKVFDPFFTTKDVGKGTGLGLAMVYGFVRQSGGHVSIYSEVGVGTSVVIVLPATGETPQAQTQLVPDGPVHRAAVGAIALVVDDEASLLEIAATYLHDLGYRVLTAPDGPSALRVLAAQARVDLLVTDVIMPGGLNGVKLSQHARRLRPELRVVFTSGFPSQALAHRSGTRVDGPLLNKPFVQREFTRVVSQVMEGVPA